MKIGLIGLGRMGQGMARRLIDHGHEVVGYDLAEDNVAELEGEGGTGARSLEELVESLEAPRHVWVMVPHGEPTRATVRALLEHVDEGDLIVDGGNSRWTESLEHAELCEAQGVRFLDIGVSGGVWGLEVGFNMMVGGPQEAVRRISPVLDALAPEDGWAHVGRNGSGHFVKMLHNAIEYAMLQSIGEGFECLHRSEFDLDLGQIAGLWSRGSVIRCWLLELLESAFTKEGNALANIGAYIDDSGTGRWTVEYALENSVPVPAIATALFERYDSRTEERFAYQVVAALRNQFGGHAVKQGSEAS